MVSEQTMRLAQQNGYQLLPKPLNYSQRHTDYIMVHPDGKTLELYDDFYQVQIDYEYGLIQPGDEFDVDVSNSPFYPNAFDYIWDVTPPPGMQAGTLFDPASWFVYILFATMIFTMVLTIIVGWSAYIIHPCEPDVTFLSKCIKVVTEPNCNQEYVDICYDGDGDGIAEGRIITPPDGWTEYLKWIVIAAVAIGGIYLAAKILPGIFERKGYPVQYFWPRKKEKEE